ncbi:unnamed protein product [Bursaphelenchus xylophilus]|uniref:(pine wood nematode) hypothetical protein n=1 Tax=Bursaphelenchus xylophilus TaxID=6326 RepID=A0A1I7SQ71_BURXY|nr:unnamed protein product [Bursaphelenchus xylophilus]CAG9109672.1 unnamed protein product [Bursaphelenchus xylophilus]
MLKQWLNLHNQRSVFALILGVCLGLFLGTFLSVDEQRDVDQYIALNSLKTTDNLRNIYVKCVVIVQPSNPKPHKFVGSIIETYGARCNRTIIFSNSNKLQRQLGDYADVFTIDSSYGWTSFSIFHRVAEFIHKEKTTVKADAIVWTVFLNEQNYIIPENLRLVAAGYTKEQAVILGKLQDYRSPFSYFFPFFDNHGFALDAGLAMSSNALGLVADYSCKPGWLSPFYSGKGLLQCAKTKGILVVDPVDEEGYHLFVEENLRNLFSTGQFTKKEKSFEDAGSKANCCSDRLISVGRVAHRDLRVMEYFAYHVKVVG